ncbi:5-carboxymethyl-2-hydroxymuconate isomerase [Novosphingobium endophyticum]|uniref:5-carboxymethyl-2-hydroxymuconate isomerase n=1 Tax=Novosphingobium endophyticum TaxID=1955250 RepID=A0A916TUY4_9SPHN|nr:5-carboxymethyl-2-hydroxymuconate isomerase [Novosphingobium endophyticum]GGC01445.1 5-carboxymethyl-2-hydroxymuconate isomerase [Novosphingobium endophyticum]
MAHAIIEWSANLEGVLDLKGLMNLIADDMANRSDGVFPIGGIRVRAYRADDYVIADDTCADDAFVNIDIKMGVGRSAEFRKAYFDALSSRITDFLADLFETRPFAFSLYVSEVDGWKKNSIHKRLKG